MVVTEPTIIRSLVQSEFTVTSADLQFQKC